MNEIFVGIEKLSLVDYEGKIACTLFTQGCNFKCPFCHNKDLVLNKNTYLNEDEIISFLEKRKKNLDAVVITGGEPTLIKQLPEVIKTIKQMGYLIKLDTNGTNLKMVKQLVENNLIDYIAMDIKNGYTKYNLTSGINNLNINNIYETINYIMTCGIDYEFRTTLVKEFHKEEDIYEIKEMIKGAKKYYLQCFTNNENCISSALTNLDKEQALKYKEILEDSIKKVELRNY